MKKFILTITMLFCVVWFTTGCSEMEQPSQSSKKTGEKLQEGENSLVGTKWKLVGFFDVEKVEFRLPDYSYIRDIIEDGNYIGQIKDTIKDTDSMYLLSFDNDSILSGKSFSNALYGNYHYTAEGLSIAINAMTEICEYGDGILYVSCLNKVQSAAIAYTNPEQLDLFYNNGKNSLRFIRRN